MEATKYKIDIQPCKQSRIAEVDFDNLGFGRHFSDHMLVADYDAGEWKKVGIEPYGRISLAPSTTALHYGQAIFEGMKAYRGPDGEALLFRPRANWQRMNRSAKRLCMPEIPEQIFMDGLRALVRLDSDWIPGSKGSSLYIRPFMFATDEYTGIRISDHYKLIIFTCPVGAYYPDPVKLMVTARDVRAFPGGTGEAKAAGNYAASLLAAKKAKEKGYDNILWLDGISHSKVEECGTMNVMFVIDGKVVTPALTGTVLHGTTRAAAIRILREAMGVEVEERELTIDEVWQAHAEGRLQEVFGTGTAATIAPVTRIGQDGSLDLPGGQEIALPPPGEAKVAPELLKRIDDIRTGRTEDPFGWVVRV